MRKFFVFLMLTLTLQVCAQNQSIEGKRPVYCDVMGYNFWGFGKVKVQLDMGDYAYHSSRSYDAIYEQDGKKKKFNTMMEVLDYMGERGWAVKSTYYITASPGHHVIHFLLEKWISDESERKEGLILKEDKEKPYEERTDDTYYIPSKKDKKDKKEKAE